MTPTTETRPEYMTDDQLQQAYDATLAALFQLETAEPDEHAAYELEATETRLLVLATEMQQRYRFTQKPLDGPPPPIPPEW